MNEDVEESSDDDGVDFKDAAAYLRKSVYASWRQANGKAILIDITSVYRRAGPLPKFKGGE